MTAYEDLMAFQRDTEALGQIAGRLGWDQETVMPRGSAEQRGHEIAAMESVLHARRIDPRVGEWLATAEPPDNTAKTNLRHIRRDYDRTGRVPVRLASELARVTSLSQGIWAEARATGDVAAFLPTFRTVLSLTREKAAALADGGDPYDALLDDHEPGATGQGLADMFAALRPRLVALRERIMGATYRPDRLCGVYDEAGQLAISDALARSFGYDLRRGRIDKAVHPFSSGSGNDVRITTRTSSDDPFNCFYSTIHEVGHAAYEQGIDQAHLLTPLGRGVSMGVHESQSRIYENQLGRSAAFTSHLFGLMKDRFGDFGVRDADAFYGTVNRVTSGYIRTDADEVHYNLHVLLRFDLERALIGGTLAPEDLEEAWNARFLADFGVAVDRPANGVLQDVHWPVGLFGYFPTYTLGNVYAGCLHKALRLAVPDLDADLANGDPSAATAWLRENLQTFGGLRPPRDTIRHACGFDPHEGPLLDYLEEKFSTIYRL